MAPPPTTVTITIIYRDFKASLIQPNDDIGAQDILQKDLAALKIPRPPKNNIDVVETGVLRFFWETTKGSTLDKHLNDKLGTRASDANRAFVEDMLPSLSIERIDFHPGTRSAATRPRKQATVTGKSLRQRITDQDTDISEAEATNRRMANLPQRPAPLQPSDPIPLSRYQRINQLTTELDAVRKRLTAELARENDIIQQLTPLTDSPHIPSLSSSDAVNALKTQLRLAEKQLEEERRRRKAAEDSLGDVQRECREPFVVPALLEAFLAISNLSSEAGG